MGAYSQLDAELRYGGAYADDEDEDCPAFVADEDNAVPAFEDNDGQEQEMEPTPAPPPVPDPVPSAGQAQAETQPAANDAVKTAADKAADEDAKRKAHEEAEAKRKAEWEAKQAQKKAEEQKKLDELAAMSDEELMTASTQRVGTDIEKLTRRSMKECVAEHIQTMCLDDPAFARKVMHPRKSMIHCIWYINRKAREFIEQEMKDNGFPKENGVYGSDVPDDLCYQWAVDYFNDPDAKEDQEKDEKFVPQPYRGTTAVSTKKSKDKGKAKKDTKKKDDPKPAPKSEGEDQISLLGVA
ncbi:MAG: hypothetical protein K2M42_10265 [Oscillospiraceae bacterium]|nr:hypothetical protein [Oscillospiraceae bacterium]